jgi:hypothetical protein
LFTGIDAPPARAGAELPGNRAERRPRGGAIPETGEAGSENSSKNAIAWRGFGLVNNARPLAFAILASFGCHSYRIRSIPLHFENVLLVADSLAASLTMDFNS